MSCVRAFDLPSAEKKAKELRALTETADFWNSDKAQEISRELSRLDARIEKISGVKNEIEELETITELLNEAEDEELLQEFFVRAGELSKKIEEYQIYVLLDGEYDAGDAIVMVHSGAGGLDAQDWAAMLYRMYVS